MYFILGMIIGFVIFWFPALWFWKWYFARKDRKWNESRINLELYRRKAVPYEEMKMKQNGDVY